MKLRQLAVVGAVSLACAGAWAEDVNVTGIDLTSGTAFFGALHFDGVAFTDTFTFSGGPALSNGTGSLITIALSPGVKDITFESANINGVLYDFTALPGGTDFGVVSFGNLASPVTITVSGMATGVGGGSAASYSGTLNVTAVPEPETYALMLAGLGAVGFMARRRRNS